MGFMGFKRALTLSSAALLLLGLQVQAMPETEAAAKASGVTAKVAKPAAAPATDACGPRKKRPGGGYYTCTFADDFDGWTLDPTYWHVMENATSGAACYVNSPDTVAVSDGQLHLTARPATDPATCPARANGTRPSYMTGAVNTFWKWSQQYGRFEVRMKSPVASGAGPHEAFWLWPDTRYSSDANWPASGEIDVAETYAAYPTLNIPFLHYSWNDNGGPRPGLNTSWSCLALRGQWHTYVLEWTASKLTISVDGLTCLTNSKGASSFRKPFIMALSQLVDDTGVNAIQDGSALPSTMDVDYVKVWQ